MRVDGGNAPDIAFIPQPGLIKRFADSGKLKAVSAETKTQAEANYSADWLKYATVNGQLYGAPFGSNVKSSCGTRRRPSRRRATRSPPPGTS